MAASTDVNKFTPSYSAPRDFQAQTPGIFKTRPRCFCLIVSRWKLLERPGTLESALDSRLIIIWISIERLSNLEELFVSEILKSRLV